ncbi:hypothetical protein BdWA1_002526 [Babesia duncani]|uniref:Uncharacterized protein n=1 Tax=Babesia duncani TaxID=323732 RepID=A0AAD9PKA4_9APIC|nr:hypothetical protein BdWA1_002526 [Babesia duncani]
MIVKACASKSYNLGINAFTRLHALQHVGLSGYTKSISSKRQGIGKNETVVAAELCGLGDAVAAMCWHRHANQKCDTGAEGAPLEGFQDEDPASANHGESVTSRNSSSKAARMIKSEMEHLLRLEQEDRERMRQEQMEKKPLEIELDKFGRPLKPLQKTFMMQQLRIAKKISSRPAPPTPHVVNACISREASYHRRVDKILRVHSKQHKSSTAKASATSDGPERVRILDVDALPLPLLHHMLCYTMVKHMPAEVVLKIISRVAVYRDRDNVTSYQKLMIDVAKMCSPHYACEIVALLSRTVQTIGIAFMLDYVRRYGTFSRRFIAGLIQKQSSPQPLDFLRYRAGQRGPNQILTRPWALYGYVKMLKKSSAKQYIYQSLLQLGYVPKEDAFEDLHAFGTLDPNMSQRILAAEKLLAQSQQNNTSANGDTDRPSLYDTLLEAQHLGISLEEQQQEEVADGPAPLNPQWQLVASKPILQEPKEPNKLLDEDPDAKDLKISWSVPWGTRRHAFHFRGSSYERDPELGWKMVKSNVRLHYSKIAKMNRRKRLAKANRKRLEKIANKNL